MTPDLPIWKLRIREIDHRVIWWLLANQEEKNGRASGLVEEGWRAELKEAMGLQDQAVNKSISMLRKAGIILHEPCTKTIRICGEAFEA